MLPGSPGTDPEIARKFSRPGTRPIGNSAASREAACILITGARILAPKCQTCPTVPLKGSRTASRGTLRPGIKRVLQPPSRVPGPPAGPPCG